MRDHAGKAGMRRAAAVLLLVAALFAHGVAVAEDPKPEGKRGAPDAAPPEAPETEAKKSELLKQTVELLDAGKKPFERLRYAPKAGTEWDVTTTVTVAYEVTMGGKVVQKSEGVTVLDATQQIESVSPKGEVTAVVVPRKMRQTTTPATPLHQNIDREANERYEILLGRAVRLTYDARGMPLSADLAAFDDLPDDLAATRSLLLGLAQGMSVPLPDEPVGVGAKWKLHREIEMLGVTVTTEDTLGPLVRGADKRWQANVVAHSKAEPQDLPSGGALGLPDTFTCRLREWKAGEPIVGTATLRLEALGSEGRVTSLVNAVFTGETEGSKLEFPLATRSTTEIKITPATKKPAGK